MNGWRVRFTINDAFINSPPSCPSPGLSIFVNGSKPGVPLRVFVFPVDTRNWEMRTGFLMGSVNRGWCKFWEWKF